MTINKNKASSKSFDYPDETPGSKIAKKLRSEANTLSGAQRESLFERGMQIIYGGSGKKR